MKLSKGLRRLFEAEIDNEHLEETGQSRDGCSSPGGDNPATLGTTLDSIRQGLELDNEDMDKLETELLALIKVHSENKELKEVI